MDALSIATGLARSGLFGEALKALETGGTTLKGRIDFHLLKCEVLERVGMHSQSRQLLSTVMKHISSQSQRSYAEQILGRLLLEDGETEDGLRRLQRASSLAEQAADLARLGWIQLNLLIVSADRSGPAASAVLGAKTR